ncbi:CPBP family intramembrane glutamic endopeptidase [Priestia filamentosa]|uniref:CAAX protease n=2 Tax=Priestia filamentosa TaxID=1402861 RepID=A0A1X7E5Z2_9BACI|nr:type II CAAX endopeptidase family protein [Priestia filamentosa]AKO92494.1 CAAX protease [Priestia filamentosa]MDT3762561.1 type II CAAX endopeptidase family protein [Priestia filamentosa]OXS69110.1 CPBP family intramembrane metalloprotease [Priestia filamentosa]RJS64181.1 CPBP family intramembrane metalloprotease [Priestia filamentosa]WCM17624.1 type II CAAX endopeptidase family protein [Priestia filamentosa]
MSTVQNHSKVEKEELNLKDAVFVFASFTLMGVAAITLLIIFDVLTLDQFLSFHNPSTLMTMTVTTTIGLILFGILLTILIPSHHIDNQNKQYQTSSISALLSLFLFGSLFEELLFRGIVQNLLLLYIEKSWVGIFITSLLFLALHVQYFKKPLMLFNILLPSLAFGWVYVKTSNILVPIIVHFLLNFVITILFKYRILKLKS